MIDGSLPRRCCHDHSATMPAVNVKIITGFTDCSAVTLIENNPPTDRSTMSRVHSSIVLPDCSYVAQNSVQGMKNKQSRMTAHQSLRLSGGRGAAASDFLRAGRSLGR